MLNEIKRHNLAEEEIERAELRDRNLDYRQVHANEAQWRINQDVKDRIQTCHRTHADCEQLEGMMQIVARALRPDWTQLTMTEYVECLYAIARNAGFAEQARQMLAHGALPK